MAQQIRAELPHRTKPDCQVHRDEDGDGNDDEDDDGPISMETIGTFNEAPYDFLKSIQGDN